MSTKIVCVVNDTVKKDSSLNCEHGLSFWIKTDHGTVLFDTGQTAAVFSHNLDVMGLSPKEIDKLALSHAHYDHTGGLGVIIANQKVIPLYANKDLFTARYSLHKKDYKEIGLAYTKAELSKYFTLRLSDAPQKIYPNLWTTGEIMERPEMIGGSEHLLIKTGADWKPDPYKDDMSLVLKTEDGLVLICGCCHAGLLNTLYHVENMFKKNIIAVVGGVHLVSTKAHNLDYVIGVIQDRFPKCRFYLNHCTGSKAISKMKEVLENQVEECHAGTSIDI